MNDKFSPKDIEGLTSWHIAGIGMWKDSKRTDPATQDGDVVGAWDDARTKRIPVWLLYLLLVLSLIIITLIVS